MIYRALADLTLLLHFAFILFVVFGGLLALPWRRAMWFHIPAVLWGVLIELVGWTCPLTPLENHFRRLGGDVGYAGSFIEQYLISLIYPGTLTRAGFVTLGLFLLGSNLLIYGWIYHSTRQPRRSG